MPGNIVLVGHCGPDNSYLKLTVKRAVPDANVVSVDSTDELKSALSTGADLVLLNRELGYGFHDKLGVDLIRELRKSHPQLKLMLVSNYAEAQQAAEAAGALPGFGKRELTSPRVAGLLKSIFQPAK